MKSNKISLILSILLTAILLLILFFNIELEEIFEGLKKVQFQYIVLAFFAHLSAYFFRTWSFYLLTEIKQISFFKLLSIHFVHNFYVHVVPASLGEFSFPILLKKEMKTSESLSILMLSRITTMFFTAILFLVSLIFIFDFNQKINFNFNQSLIIFAIAFLFLSLLFYFRRRIIIQLNKIKILYKIFEKINSFYLTIKSKVLKLKNRATLILFLCSVLISIIATSLFFLLILIGLGLDLNLLQVIFVSSIGVAFIILPIKSIGGFGTTEGAWTIGLMLLSFSKEAAITVGFVVHIYALINVIIILGIGILLKFILRNANKQIQ